MYKIHIIHLAIFRHSGRWMYDKASHFVSLALWPSFLL